MKKRNNLQPWFHRYLIAAIRKIWRYSPARRMARQLAAHPTKKDKKGRPHQLCALDGRYHKHEDTQVDHIQSAVAITGFVDWNTFIERTLAITVEQTQVLCKSCHKKKSNEENGQRRTFKSETAERE